MDESAILDPVMSVHGSILDLIGDTPMLDVSHLSSNPRVRILAKLENQNPTGSVKDRAAKAMIEDAEAVLMGQGFAAGGRKNPGNLHIEKYW